MSQYYSGKRSRNIFSPTSDKPFKLSRTKLELFMKCPRCFYIDRRLGVGQPPGFPFNINSAIDELLKREFDEYRHAGKTHPLMQDASIEAVPAHHNQLDEWRENFKGVQTTHKQTGLVITGAIDDLWITSQGEYLVVDYKATSKDGSVSLDAPWQISYKRQMEIYQWLLRQNGLTVSNTGYFVYCNGKKNSSRFDAHLDFDISLIPYVGDASWVETCIVEAYNCLMSNTIPLENPDCDYCIYYSAVNDSLESSS